jgi:putative NIF3 family GTP cyclohydrolase 1 type 2
MEFYEFLGRLKKLFKKDKFPYLKTKNFLKKGALICGSGGGFIEKIEADILLTGDIKYHDSIKAREDNLSLVDIGHYESEKYFAQALSQSLKNYSIEVIITNTDNPLKE